LSNPKELNRSTASVTASAIQTVKINQNPYTALYSRLGRARVEITTKSGTSKLHGSGTFLYRDSLFDARNGFAVSKPSEQRTYFEGSLTGPLTQNKKTTFLLALDEDNDNQQAIALAAGPNGDITANVPNPTHHYFLSGRVFMTMVGLISSGSATPRSTRRYKIRVWVESFFPGLGPTRCFSNMRSTLVTFTSSPPSL
jgi:hypothetical protein